jgi:uncharacterized repeat protein (TIGR03803 family)
VFSSSRIALCAVLILLTASLTNPAGAWTFKTIHNFCAKGRCKDGALPNPILTMDMAGNLYGTTYIGGYKNHGVIFELQSGVSGKWIYKTLWTFCRVQKCSDPGRTEAAVVLDTSGNVYGSGPFGREGRYQIFEIAPDGTYALLHVLATGEVLNGMLTYAGAEGGSPYDGSSPLYGTTADSAFALTSLRGRWREQSLYTFCSQPDCSDGEDADASPTVLSPQELIGVTARGGTFHDGVLYSLQSRKKGWFEQSLHSFCQMSGCTDGSLPATPAIEDAAGDVFGTAGGGDYQQGVVYELAADGTFDVLYSFCQQTNCRDGAAPQGGLALDPAGNLYGTTSAGGAHGVGTIYEVSHGTETVLHDFCSDSGCADGEVPVSQLVRDSKGDLFGTTRGGGNSSLEGVVFELTP